MKDTETDGKRIAELLSSEIHGRESGPLAHLSVAEANPDADPEEFDVRAYGIDYDDERLANVYLHPDRIHVEFRLGVDAAAEAGEAVGLRTRPKAAEPPRTLVFVESGAEVKRAVDVLATVVESLPSR